MTLKHSDMKTQVIIPKSKTIKNAIAKHPTKGIFRIEKDSFPFQISENVNDRQYARSVYYICPDFDCVAMVCMWIMEGE